MKQRELWDVGALALALGAAACGGEPQPAAEAPEAAPANAAASAPEDALPASP